MFGTLWKGLFKYTENNSRYVHIGYTNNIIISLSGLLQVYYCMYVRYGPTDYAKYTKTGLSHYQEIVVGYQMLQTDIRDPHSVSPAKTVRLWDAQGAEIVRPDLQSCVR